MRRWLALAAIVLGGFAIALFVLVRRGNEPPAPAVIVAIDAAPRAVPPPSQPPPIDAPRHDLDATATSERDELLTGLRESGKGDEVWDAQATALFVAIGRSPAVGVLEGCYIAGCGATFTFPSAADYQRRLGELDQLDGYRAWTGGKRLTSPETRPDGHVVIAIVLYRPD